MNRKYINFIQEKHQGLNLAEEIDIISNCPICKKPITCIIDKRIILNASSLPVPFKIEHCGNKFIIFIDANFKCVETRLLFPVKEEDRNNPIDPRFRSKLTSDDLTVYEYKLESGFLLDSIPDLTERHLIRVILKNKEVSLGRLIRECTVLEKALNKNITREGLLNILDKYAEKEIIIKHELKIEEEESSSQFKTNILQGGNL